MPCSNVNYLFLSCNSAHYREKKRHKKGSDNTEVANAIKKYHVQFPDYRTLYNHVLGLYVQQKGRCAISGLIMSNEKAGSNYYRVSLDAISPKKGHVKDNLRVICSFLNSVNTDSHNSNYDANDTSGSWSTKSLHDYIGYSDNEGISTA